MQMRMREKTNTPFFHPKSHLSIKSCVQNVYRIKHTGASFRQMDKFFPVTVVVFNNFSFLHIVCDGDGGAVHRGRGEEKKI